MKVVCYGDSNTFGYDPRGYFGGRYDAPWPEILGENLSCTILNWGLNGREIPERAVNFPADTDLLIIMLGTNDLLQFRTPEAACGKMELFLQTLTLERNKILLLAPPPFKPGEWVPNQTLIADSITLAKYYRTLAARLGVHFADAGEWNIPLAYDGVHLTEEGHRAFAEDLIVYLKKENELCWKLA